MTSGPAKTARPADVHALADAWFNQQMRRAEAKHGTSWPEHREWVADYLREEVRQRLAARGTGGQAS